MELEGFAVQGGDIVEPATGRQNLAIDKISGNVIYLSHALSASLVTGELSEFEERRIVRLTKRYKQAKEVAGPAWSILEDMLLDEVWPVGERGHKAISEALTRLSQFFCTGTKRKR